MSQPIVHATIASFEQDVLKQSEPVLVDFWAEWCTPCKDIAPHLEAMAQAGARIVKVDIESEMDVATQYQVVSIPTLAIFKEGKEVERLVGFRNKEELEAALARHTS